MPLPKPHKDEKQSDFVSRCMSDATMRKEFPKDDQRVAVCVNIFKDKDQSKSSERVNFVFQPDQLNYTDAEVKDTINIGFKLCHANKNLNLDEMPYEEVKSSAHTALGKPIVYSEYKGHTGTYVIGYIDEVYFVDTINNKVYKADKYSLNEIEGAQLNQYGYKYGEDSYIYCKAIIYRNRFPVEADDIRKLFEKNQLYFSMETYFESCTCGECGRTFYREADYCEHLEDRWMTGTARILHDLTYTGAAVVDYPADKGAVGLSAASKGFSVLDILDEDKIDNETYRFILNMRLQNENT